MSATGDRAKGKTVTGEDLKKILYGCTFLASGGGGPLQLGLRLIEKVKEINLVAPDELDDDDEGWVGCFIGEPSALIKLPNYSGGLTAATMLQNFVSKQFNYVAAVELGGFNTAVAMSLASDKGIAMVNGDGAGRAVPKLSMLSYGANNEASPISPICAASSDNKFSTILPNVDGADDAEDIFRPLVGLPEAGGVLGLGLWQMNGATCKSVIVQNTLNLASQVGTILLDGQGDYINRVVKLVKGKILYQGYICRTPQQTTSGGFDFGVVALSTKPQCPGALDADFYIINQNENILAYNTKDPKPVCMGPDMICYLTPQGEVFDNSSASNFVGKEVAIIGVPCRPELRKQPILNNFRLTHQSLGYYGPYVPVEDL